MAYYQLENLSKAKVEIRKAFNGDYSLRQKYPDAQTKYESPAGFLIAKLKPDDK